MPRWTGIILHHSLTEDSDKALPDTVAIRRFHTSYRQWGNIITEEEYQKLSSEGAGGLSRPWLDIGYHWLVETLSDGRPWVIQGRSMMLAGAHTIGKNRSAIGLCAVGNFDLAPPPEATFEKLAEHTAWLCRMYHIPVDNIQGHRHYASYKSCPGTKFDMEYFRERVAEYRSQWQV